MFYSLGMEMDDRPARDDAVFADAVDPSDFLEGPDSVDLVVEVATMMSVFAGQRLRRVDAMRREALADAAVRGFTAADVVERGVRLELAAALLITEHVADALLARAEALVHRYPRVLEVLEGGCTTEAHADFFVAAMAPVEPEFREPITDHAIVLMQTEALGTFRRSLRRLIATARAKTLEERHSEALAQRRVVVEEADDGMAWLSAFLPAVEARAIHGRLTAMAKIIAEGSVTPVSGDPDAAAAVADAVAATATDVSSIGTGAAAASTTGGDAFARTLDQIRADVFADLLIEGDTRTVPPAARGLRATVAVTVPALSLLGGDTAGDGEPAVVEGIGPIPMSRARELCGGDARWMRVLTHPETGIVLSVGRDQYSPPPELRKLVKWRADRCMAPGCGMPASRCEIDHSIAWQHGGTTSLWNLAPLCKGHHIVKHHSGWIVRQLEGGALEWTSPAGRRYVVRPLRRVPVFRPSEGAPAPF